MEEREQKPPDQEARSFRPPGLKTKNSFGGPAPTNVAEFPAQRGRQQENSMAIARTDTHSRPARPGSLIAALAWLGLAASFPLSASDFFDYKGSDWCADCHIDKVSSWQGTGHSQMLMTAEQARGHGIPLPSGYTWDDISYVVGGHRWKARFLDKDGYFITTVSDRDGTVRDGDNQWNIPAGTWSDYHAGEANLPYDCGACHTTGWKPDTNADVDGTLADNQGGLPGIHGTFELPGVQCEACHGPGFTMVVDETAAFCGSCHSRTPTNKIQVSGNFIRHEQQYNEFLSSPHASRTCITCHDPHESGQAAIQRQCRDCHTSQAESYASSKMSAAGVDCVDCHMPKASLSGEPAGEWQGDVRTHIFRINTGSDQRMFTLDGQYVRADAQGQSSVNLAFACKSCHAAQSDGWLQANAANFHDASFRINAGISGTWWAGAERDGEGWLLDAAANAFVAAMYTYNASGEQTWLLGAGMPEGDVVSVGLEIPEGPSFGSHYDPNDVTRTPWGTANFLFTSCTEGTVELEPNADMQARGFEAMTVNIERLTTSAASCIGSN